MRSFGFAWRSLTRERARGVLGVAGVAIVGALLLDMLLLSHGLVLSFREILLSTGFDLRVTATKALPGTGPAISDASRAAEEIAALSEVGGVARMRFGSASAWVRGTKKPALPVSIVGTSSRTSGEWRVVSGEDLSYPSAPGVLELVANEPFARELGLSPGSSVVIYPGVVPESIQPTATFRVVGIAEFPFEARGQAAAKMTMETYRAVGIGPDRDEADMLLVSSKDPGRAEETARAIRALRPDLTAFSIEELLERFRRNEFSYFRQISFVLSAITSFFAALLVTTLLTVSVNQRLGEIAALRALGFSRMRVALDLLAESGLLLAAGGLLALPLGAGVAVLLDSILREMPGLPEDLHFFVADPRAVATLAAILLASAVLAAVYPVWIVARLPIAATLRKEVVS